MSISFVSAGGTAKADHGNVTPALPPGWAAGDLFICAIASLDNVNSTLPSGWRAIDTGTNNGNGLRTTVYYKIATVGNKNPVVTHTAGNNIVAAIVAYRGVDSTTPVDVIGTTRVNSYSTTVTATSINTISNNDWVIFTGGISSKSTFSNYSGTPTPIERLDVPNDTNYPSMFVTDFAMTSPGSTGNRTCTATSAGVNNGLLFGLKPATATIICITDPSDAYIYIDGVVQPVLTSEPVSVQTGTHTVTFSKPGYYPYTETVTGLGANQTVKVSAILIQIVNITDQGIVICTTSDISSCPTLPIDCPTQITSLDYINFIAVISSTISTTVTIRFFYSANGISNYQDINITLPAGTSVVYAFPTNQQYPPNTILTLDDIELV